MSLQVCHCGWSKVTTYQGLRIHQGKMGCMPRGMRVEESEQQHMWGNVGFTNDQKDLRLDIYTSIKTDTTDYYSDMSLQVQVCHRCGWSKVTTYQGLRIHQGKMGCTPKGMRIPKREQYDWKNQWEEVDQRKHQPAKRMTVKKENAPLPPSPPSTKVRTNSAATTATVKEEYKSSFATSQHSFQTASNSKSRRQLHYFSTGVQVNRSVREHPTPTYPVTVLRPTEKDRKDQTLSRIADSSRVTTGNWSINSHTDDATTAATIKEEPKSPLAIPQRSSQRVTNSKSGRQPQDFSTGVQVNRSFRERPTIPPPITVVQPKEKDRKDQTLSQPSPSINSATTATIKEEPKSPFATPQRSSQRVTNSTGSHQLQDFCTGVQANRSSRECPTAPPVAAVVQPKKKDRKDQTLSQSVPDSASTNTQTNSAAAEATTEEYPKSLCETEQPDFSTGMKVKELARMFSATTTQETAVRPKGKHREEQKLSPVRHLAQKLSATTAQETAVQPKEKDKEVQKLSQNKPDSTSATTKMKQNESAEATTEEDPKSSCETAQLSDFSSGMKVKELARMFSATTTQETAVRLKGKHREERKRSQTGEAYSPEAFSYHSPGNSSPTKGERQGGSKPNTVDVKLDPTTADRCLVSADGKKVSNGGENQEALGRFGSVLGLNRLTSGRLYWEVVVSNQTGWELGVVRGNANRRGKLSLNPDNSYWVTVHYENKEYAALSAPPVRLSLKGKPQKVGVFVDYEEGLVSFYDVTAQSHIYSFTECSFTGEIYPYFSLQLKEDGERADPLIISTVKHQ